jgi:voltage-dependent anion channel protein 2
MPSAIPAKDIGKTCSDLLSKDFTVGKSVLEVKSKTANGVTFTPKATKADGKGVDGSLKGEYKFPGDISGEATIDTAGVIATTLKTSRFAKGLTLSLDCKASGSAVTGAEVAADYKQDAFTAKGTYEYYKQAATAAASAAYGSFTLGCTADYSLSKSAIGKYAVACQYVQPDFTLCSKISDAPSKPGSKAYSGSYFHKISSAMQVGTELTQTKDVSLSFGCLYKLDKTTTVKGKVDTNGILTASYKQAISPISTLTLAAVVDTVDLQSSSKHKVGMSLNLTP